MQAAKHTNELMHFYVWYPAFMLKTSEAPSSVFNRNNPTSRTSVHDITCFRLDPISAQKNNKKQEFLCSEFCFVDWETRNFGSTCILSCLMQGNHISCRSMNLEHFMWNSLEVPPHQLEIKKWTIYCCKCVQLTDSNPEIKLFAVYVMIKHVWGPQDTCKKRRGTWYKLKNGKCKILELIITVKYD